MTDHRKSLRRSLRTSASAIALALGALAAPPLLLAPAAAEDRLLATERAAPAEDPDTVPYRRRPGETLSETLEREDGVLDPGMEAGPEMTIVPPDPEPGTTPVIPPPEEGMPPQPPQTQGRLDGLPFFPWEEAI